MRGGRIYRLKDTITLPGGKGVNVARALRSLGLAVPIAGFASGYNGRWIAAHLKSEGFRTFIQRHADGESRVCYTIVDPKGRSTDFNEEGPRVPLAAQNAFLRKFARLTGEFKAVAVCGRVSAGLKKDFYSSLVRLASDKDCFSVFDTSGPALAEAMAAGVEGVKINRGEFEELSRSAFSPSRIFSFFRAGNPRGLKTLIVTDGAGPAYAASPFGLWRIKPPRIARLKSSVGAGDSFMAGFLYGFLKGLDFELTLKLAAGAGASDCLSLGAGFINKPQALALARAAEVRKIG